MTTAKNDSHYDSNAKILIAEGNWELSSLPQLRSLLKSIQIQPADVLTIDAKNLRNMDTAGAWLLNNWLHTLQKNEVEVRFINFSEEHQKLLSIVNETVQSEEQLVPPQELNRLAIVGKYTIDQVDEIIRFLAFVGMLTAEMFRLIPLPSRWRFASLANIIYRNGFLALPIIAVLSFMIGVVLTYQMGLQLRNYGANVYIVDLLGLAVLREFSPLLTAIMVAGRTGSAFTAQLGMMKVNQEIDALNTMGVTPAELLILPRIIALFLILPLLTVWADFFGIFGGMIMSTSMLNITWYDFLHRFPHVVKLKSLIIGLGKAPVFALIIASIGCFQGMNVGTSADSVGRNTTRSVVLAIFFIIVVDAIFSVIFSVLKI